MQATAGEFLIDPATLAVSLKPPGGAVIALAAPALRGTVQGDPSQQPWHVVSGSDSFRVSALIDEGALQISVRSDHPATLAWPQTTASRAIVAYALPIGEGSYVPADDPVWLDWLVRRYAPSPLVGTLSMPFWTELRGDRSITWTVETPLDTDFGIQAVERRPQPFLRHDFHRLAPDAPYTVRIVSGPPDALDGARRYRRWLQSNGQFRALTDKIAALPDVARLGGAAHIYLWGAGPLKPGDVLQWRAFLRRLQQQKDDAGSLSGRLWRAFDAEARARFEAAFQEAAGEAGFVAAWRRAGLTRALNAALREAHPRPVVAPLPGGHDPSAEVLWGQAIRAELAAAYGPLLAPASRWGGGLSSDTVAALQAAGLTRAWLGSDDWRDALWHPEAVAAAKAAGYLVGVYDSYGSAHSSKLPDTWATAQMGDELAKAGYRDAAGQLRTGFAGRGVYVHAGATEAYARRRMKAIAEAAGLNSYFLDVDGAGPQFADYTPGRETSEAQDTVWRQRRLVYPGEALGLVTGTEGVVAMFVPQVAFAHGITTQPFAWMDPDIKDKTSRWYRGGYWPPETPTLYFNPVPLKPALVHVLMAPEFRLPLYETVLHDSVVITHHWEYGSLKFSNASVTTALVQWLYMVPPLYHLNESVLARDLPLIAAYDRAFRPWHERLYTQAMTDWRVLSTDRLLQRSRFADGTTVTVNFDGRARRLEGGELPAHSVRIAAVGAPAQTVEIDRVMKTSPSGARAVGQSGAGG
ncbi:glycoside hydrolase [Variovorax sp. LT1R16]